jgi:hypothetical protein
MDFFTGCGIFLLHVIGIFGCPLPSIAAYTLGIADLNGQRPSRPKIASSSIPRQGFSQHQPGRHPVRIDR